MRCWNHLLCAFHSLLLVLPQGTTQPETNPSFTWQPPGMWRQLNVLFSRPNGSNLQLFFSHAGFWSFCCTVVPLSDITHLISMWSIFIYRIVTEPWMLSIIPGLGKESRIKCSICRGSHQHTERTLYEAEAKWQSLLLFDLWGPESHLELETWDVNECLPTPWLQENGFQFLRWLQ